MAPGSGTHAFRQGRGGAAAGRGRGIRLRVLITGARGQLGWELARSLNSIGTVVALDRNALDLARADSITAATRTYAPQIIINAGAYTAVDKAESEPDLAQAVNAAAPA